MLHLVGGTVSCILSKEVQIEGFTSVFFFYRGKLFVVSHHFGDLLFFHVWGGGMEASLFCGRLRVKCGT